MANLITPRTLINRYLENTEVSQNALTDHRRRSQRLTPSSARTVSYSEIEGTRPPLQVPKSKRRSSFSDITPKSTIQRFLETHHVAKPETRKQKNVEGTKGTGGNFSNLSSERRRSNRLVPLNTANPETSNQKDVKQTSGAGRGHWSLMSKRRISSRLVPPVIETPGKDMTPRTAIKGFLRQAVAQTPVQAHRQSGTPDLPPIPPEARFIVEDSPFNVTVGPRPRRSPRTVHQENSSTAHLEFTLGSIVEDESEMDFTDVIPETQTDNSQGGNTGAEADCEESEEGRAETGEESGGTRLEPGEESVESVEGRAETGEESGGTRVEPGEESVESVEGRAETGEESGGTRVEPGEESVESVEGRAETGEESGGTRVEPGEESVESVEGTAETGEESGGMRVEPGEESVESEEGRAETGEVSVETEEGRAETGEESRGIRVEAGEESVETEEGRAETGEESRGIRVEPGEESVETEEARAETGEESGGTRVEPGEESVETGENRVELDGESNTNRGERAIDPGEIDTELEVENEDNDILQAKNRSSMTTTRQSVGAVQRRASVVEENILLSDANRKGSLHTEREFTADAQVNQGEQTPEVRNTPSTRFDRTLKSGKKSLPYGSTPRSQTKSDHPGSRTEERNTSTRSNRGIEYTPRSARKSLPDRSNPRSQTKSDHPGSWTEERNTSTRSNRGIEDTPRSARKSLPDRSNPRSQTKSDHPGSRTEERNTSTRSNRGIEYTPRSARKSLPDRSNPHSQTKSDHPGSRTEERNTSTRSNRGIEDTPRSARKSRKFLPDRSTLDSQTNSARMSSHPEGDEVSDSSSDDGNDDDLPVGALEEGYESGYSKDKSHTGTPRLSEGKKKLNRRSSAADQPGISARHDRKRKRSASDLADINPPGGRHKVRRRETIEYPELEESLEESVVDRMEASGEDNESNVAEDHDNESDINRGDGDNMDDDDDEENTDQGEGERLADLPSTKSSDNSRVRQSVSKRRTEDISAASSDEEENVQRQASRLVPELHVGNSPSVLGEAPSRGLRDKSADVPAYSSTGPGDLLDSDESSDEEARQSQMTYAAVRTPNASAIEKTSFMAVQRSVLSVSRGKRRMTSTPKSKAKMKKGEKTVVKPPKKPREVKMPSQLTKALFCNAAKSTISKEVLCEVEKVADQFWENLGSDLEAFARHAHRKTITLDDVELLMKRQRFVTEKKSMFFLVEQNLPLEFKREIVPTARAGNVVYPKPRH